MFLRLAAKSLINRKGSVLLTIMAMTVSVFVLLGVEHIRGQAKDSFSNTVSGVDLIAGARTGSLNLLLYSVFHLGAPTNNISWESFNRFSSHPDVAWTVPISLGDSHKGFRVLGTSRDFFVQYSYGNRHKLSFKQGSPFDGVFDVVLGYEVAEKLGYQIGDTLVLAHGVGNTSFSVHDDNPFRVVGILAGTGTPVDQTLHVSLQGIEAIHVDWNQGVKVPGKSTSREELEAMQLRPKSITAFMVGLKSRLKTFYLQKEISNYDGEPLTAILPGATLAELWQIMGVIETILRLVSFLVLLAALLGLSAMLLASFRERQHEVHLLRMIGAPPWFLFVLIEVEALMIGLISTALGFFFLLVCISIAGEFLAIHFGLQINANLFTQSSIVIMTLVMISTFISAAVPSILAYIKSKSIRYE